MAWNDYKKLRYDPSKLKMYKSENVQNIWQEDKLYNI